MPYFGHGKRIVTINPRIFRRHARVRGHTRAYRHTLPILERGSGGNDFLGQFPTVTTEQVQSLLNQGKRSAIEQAVARQSSYSMKMFRTCCATKYPATIVPP
jgi:uncharacterized protein (DUF433 family)